MRQAGAARRPVPVRSAVAGWLTACVRCTSAWAAIAALWFVVGAPVAGHAQEPPDSVRRDSSVAIPPIPALPDEVGSVGVLNRRRAPLGRAPLSPGRAFLLSFAVPGLAQSRLDRTTSGALFAAVEMAAFAMLRRSQADVAEVRRQPTDTVPGNFSADPGTGSLTAVLNIPRGLDATLARTRRLHVEDWIAVLAFNHLISASDAFVAAQLWDVPATVSLLPSPNGWYLMASVGW